MTISLKQGWLLAVLIVFLLLGCSDELITGSKGDPRPEIEEGEETPTSTDHLDAANLIVAQNSIPSGRVPLPNDLILARINEIRVSTGQAALNGTSPNMPVRIPFTNSIDVPDFDYSSEAGMTMAVQWASNILIVPLGLSDAADADPQAKADYLAILNNPITATEETAPFLALPTHDAAGNPISLTLGEQMYTGKFKTVYQDANHDLVLVPRTTTSTSSGTFKKGRKYALIIKKSLKEGLIEDTLFAVLKSDDPLYEGTTIKNPLLIAQDADLATVITLETLRLGFASILTAASLSKEEVAVVQTFMSEYSTATETAVTESLIGAMFLNAINTAKAANNPIAWATAIPGSSTTDAATAFDYKSVFQGAGISVDNISNILSGFYTCQNFLANFGSDETPVWTLDLPNRANTPGADCPHTNNNLEGKIQFWLAVPSVSITGIVVYQHGINRNKDDFAAVANTFAGAGLATIAIDSWNHGTRTYEDADGDGLVESTTSMDSNNPGDSGLLYIRPDNPFLSVGYTVQTLVDIGQLTIMLKSNTALLSSLGLTVADDPTLHFVGHSLGGIFGSMASVLLGSLGTPPYTRMVLNTPGGDLTDIVLQSPTFGPVIKAGVAETLGLPNPSPELNATMLGLELGTMHALAAGNVEPLIFANRDTPASILLQEIKGDNVVPNSNSELLARTMGLTKMKDGEGAADVSESRVQWIFDPSNYTANPSVNPNDNPAGHGFFIDGQTSATVQGQLQALCYLLRGNILDPSLTINPVTCTN